VNFHRVITSLYVVLFLGLGLTAGVLFFAARGEYNRLKETETASRQRLAEKEAQLHEQEKILERLRTDPEYVERVIRKRLGYVKPDEIIFQFRD
jgi:cell division protein DivIC